MNLPKLELWTGRLPIGRFIEAILIIALVAAVLAISGCASAPTKEPEAPMGINEVNAARAVALQKIGESAAPSDGETRRLALFALMAMGTNQAAPQQVVQQGPRSIGDAIFGFLDRTLERALNIAPAYLAYKGQVRAAQTAENVAAIGRDVAVNQSNNFLALGLGGIGGTAVVGVAGVNALATVAARPVSPSSVTTITGNSGPVNTGGTLTFAPVTSSNNPVTNPTPVPPRICTTSATGALICQGG